MTTITNLEPNALMIVSNLVLVLALALMVSWVWVEEREIFASSNNEDEEEEEQQEEDSTTTEDTQDTVAAEYKPETCFTLTIPECNEVNAKFATEQTFLPRCQVTLADGQLITIYKERTKTCSTSQEELGGYTYQRYQEEAMQEFNNEMNEARRSFGEMFAP